MDIVKAAIKLLDNADKKCNYPLETYLIHDELNEYFNELSNKKTYTDEKTLVLDLLNSYEASPFIEMVKIEITKQ